MCDIAQLRRLAVFDFINPGEFYVCRVADKKRSGNVENLMEVTPMDRKGPRQSGY